MQCNYDFYSAITATTTKSNVVAVVVVQAVCHGKGAKCYTILHNLVTWYGDTL